MTNFIVFMLFILLLEEARLFDWGLGFAIIEHPILSTAPQCGCGLGRLILKGKENE